MSIYTVHEPPLKAGESTPDPDRFVFVRDGFSFWAFLLAPLWMLRHRLWLVFVPAGVAGRFRGRDITSVHAVAPALEQRRRRRR